MIHHFSKIKIIQSPKMLEPHTTLNCNGKILDLSSPIVMGILNVTPDSFYDGGKLNSDKKVLNVVEKMINDGAAVLDVGGVSTRPGASEVDAVEEIKRVVPVIKSIQKEFPQVILSIDTFRSKVAVAAVEFGASIVNDISAGRFDDKLLSIVGELGVPYILMHMQGKPENMQKQPTYNNVIEEVVDFMIAKVNDLRSVGIKDIVIDPGFGFGKTVDHNFELLKNLDAFKILDVPILAGISRKSMICKVLNVNPKDALNGTTALHMIALQKGAKILRVHDVKEAKQTIKLWQQIEAI
jgi:dihydropteroate synthase